VEVRERPEHLGLLRTISAGVGEVMDAHGRIIMLEDDLVTAPGFLRYMNDALESYANEPRVMQVSGYRFPMRVSCDRPFFLPLPTSWGWATWERSWRHFDLRMAGAKAILEHPHRRRQFDLDGAYPYSTLLEAQLQGRSDSWAVRWYLAAFLQKGLTLYPPWSLVQNIGFDGSGTHPACTSMFDTAVGNGEIGEFPRNTEIDEKCWRAVVRYLRKARAPAVPSARGLWHSVRHALRRGMAAIAVRD
jgi:hypothetical protein